jgi:hypothetical protein
LRDAGSPEGSGNLKEPQNSWDTTPSVIPAPGDVPQVTPEYVQGAHVLGVTLGPLPGTQALGNTSDYGYSLYVAVMPQVEFENRGTPSRGRECQRAPKLHRQHVAKNVWSFAAL